MVWKLAQSPRKPTLYCAPGNAGIESLAICVPIKAEDIAGLKAFVQSEKIDLTVVGPEAPLASGIVDEFRKSKLKIFGPTKGCGTHRSQQSLFQRDHEPARRFLRRRRKVLIRSLQPWPISISMRFLSS